jgi:hypothetical protein
MEHRLIPVMVLLSLLLITDAVAGNSNLKVAVASALDGAGAATLGAGAGG